MVRFEGGGGEWARGPDQLDTINRCRRMVQQDFGPYLKADAVVKVAVYDVAQHGTVYVGDDGVQLEDGKWVQRCSVVEVTINAKRRR